MDISKILSSDAFKALDPAQAQAYAALAQKLEGKSTAEALPVVMAFAATLPKGTPLTKEQQRAMMEAAMASMSADEQKKFGMLMKML